MQDRRSGRKSFSPSNGRRHADRPGIALRRFSPARAVTPTRYGHEGATRLVAGGTETLSPRDMTAPPASPHNKATPRQRLLPWEQATPQLAKESVPGCGGPAMRSGTTARPHLRRHRSERRIGTRATRPARGPRGPALPVAGTCPVSRAPAAGTRPPPGGADGAPPGASRPATQTRPPRRRDSR